mgnify:CR=1 FL=1
MPSANNVVSLDGFKRSTQQELIDDIGARAFLFIRDAATEQGLPIRDVIVEHMLGMAMVIDAVEGRKEAKDILQSISEKLDCA